tara:strand:+ start:188 stop:553 length:366 start_codon:yes stop_codon:yes gene_type:complete
MGASGFLGSHLCSFLKVKNTVLRCGRSQKNDIILRKINEKNFSKILKKHSPNVVINLIALTDVDLCEKKKKKLKKLILKLLKPSLIQSIKLNYQRKFFFFKYLLIKYIQGRALTKRTLQSQ